MKQEYKELLLKDLCGRLPYGIKAAFFDIEDECEDFDIVEYIDVSNKEHEIGIGQYCLSIDKIKPYLFPLSSMTEEQKEELIEVIHPKDTAILAEILRKKAKGESVNGYGITHHAADWCNKNHFDYRGLIPMGLAKDATGLNIY